MKFLYVVTLAGSASSSTSCSCSISSLGASVTELFWLMNGVRPVDSPLRPRFGVPVNYFKIQQTSILP